MATRLLDADLLTEVMRGWDLDFRQLDRGRIEARLAHVAAGPVLITECSMTRRIEQHGAPPPGFRTFAIPANDGMRVRWRGQDHNGTSMMLFRVDGEIDCVSDERFHVFTVSVAEDWLRSAAARRSSDCLKRFETGSGVTTCSPQTRQQLRALTRRLVEAATAQPEVIADPAYQQVLGGELVASLLDAVDESAEIRQRPMAHTRNRTLLKAIEVISARASEPVSIAEVERHSGSSTRTLRYAFQEAFGVSPKQYLQAHRLNQVRRRLRQTPPEVRGIAQIANEWGFWHMGQFAKDYRQMFGELPSQTQTGHVG